LVYVPPQLTFNVSDSFLRARDCTASRLINRARVELSSNPAALHRGDLRYRRDEILEHSSNEYVALADELEKLETEALNDDESGPDIY
jgi:hypothetical protein